MMRAENSSLPELCVLPRSGSKNTPGGRCNWGTSAQPGPVKPTEPEACIPRMRRDREDRGERRLQSFVPARFGRHMRLQERGVGLELRREQERHVLHVAA